MGNPDSGLTFHNVTYVVSTDNEQFETEALYDSETHQISILNELKLGSKKANRAWIVFDDDTKMRVCPNPHEPYALDEEGMCPFCGNQQLQGEFLVEWGPNWYLVNVSPDGSSEITSNLKEDEEEDEEENQDYNTAIDAIESLILAHACAGIDVTSEQYKQGVKTAVDACATNM